MTDFYEVLGVRKDSTNKEIRTAYRKLSLKYHPDKGGNAEKFGEIAKAYEFLKDENSRKQYDESLIKNNCINNSFDTMAKINDWLKVLVNGKSDIIHTANVIQSIYNPSVAIEKECRNAYGNKFYRDICSTLDDCPENTHNLANDLLANIHDLKYSVYFMGDEKTHFINVINYIANPDHTAMFA